MAVKELDEAAFEMLCMPSMCHTAHVIATCVGLNFVFVFHTSFRLIDFHVSLSMAQTQFLFPFQTG